MASKKEHRRRMKSRGRHERVDEKREPEVSAGPEINSLDLLSSLHGLPKASEAEPESGDGAAAAKRDPGSAPSVPGEEPPDGAGMEREMEARAEERASEYAGDEDSPAVGSAGKNPDARLEEERERRALDEAAGLQSAREGEERRRLEEKERERRACEEAARKEEERLRREDAERMAEEAERKRLEAEEEKARRRAEEEEKARADAERLRLAREDKAERERRERAARQAAADERARQMAAAGERARKMAEKVERARREAEEREAASRQPAASGLPAPTLEVANPYWERSPEIFEMLSGAPHGDAAPPYNAPAYAGGPYDAAPPDASRHGGAGESGQSLPVTMAFQPGNGNFRIPNPAGDIPEDVSDPNRTVPVPLEKRMYIVMVTPEVAPCAKVGGLGDVILGLGRELMKRGHGVEVICPMYSSIRYDQVYDMHEEYGELWSPHYNEWRPEKVFQGKVEGGLQVNFITGGTYTERPSIYGFDDDLQRFTYFSRQALEFMFKTNRRPDIIHCHDWATGLVPAILWDVYQKLGWDNSRVVYTIHNNECQGLCGFGDKLLSMVGLDVKNYYRPDRMQDDTHKNCINMMKGGIVYSNFVTTVSPTYAGELKTVAGGRGLQQTIARNSAKVGGVLNGIDYDSWNPQSDPKLTARYSGGEDFFEKYQNKKALREWLGLWDAWKPIVSVVTRLTRQKGLDLIKAAIFQTLEMEGQFVLLGSAPDPKVNADFLRLQHDLRDNHDVNLYIGYHEDLSRLIYAGSDMFLVPSLYEPCGLTQMISLRYGTVPIVRETGGLVDTVFDLDNSGRALSDANGFTFRDPDPVSLHYGLSRAIRLWYDNPEAFNRLARNGMRYDYSWKHPTEHYENIYHYIKA